MFEDKGAAPRLDLIADAVAVPDCAATCDPATLIRGSLGASIRNVRTIFPNPPGGLGRFPGFHSGERKEYVALTVRQLILRLSTNCLGGASVFPVGKAGGKQRVVWNGTRNTVLWQRLDQRHLCISLTLRLLACWTSSPAFVCV